LPTVPDKTGNNPVQTGLNSFLPCSDDRLKPGALLVYFAFAE
jgi:hypothetical protein